MFGRKFYDKATEDSLEIILSIPLITKFNQLNFEQLKLFASEFFHFANYFPRYLGALIWHSPYDGIRLAIIENLIDESGGLEKIHNLDATLAHPNLFKKFTSIFGISNEELLESNISKLYTKNMLTQLKELSFSDDFFLSLGGVAPGIENIFSIWIEHILNGLKSHSFLTNESLCYFSLHAVVDKEHGRKLRQCVAPLLVTEEQGQQLYEGSIKMAKILRDFFNGLTNDLLILEKKTVSSQRCNEIVGAIS